MVSHLSVASSRFVAEELKGHAVRAAKHRFACRILCRLLDGLGGLGLRGFGDFWDLGVLGDLGGLRGVVCLGKGPKGRDFPWQAVGAREEDRGRSPCFPFLGGFKHQPFGPKASFRCERWGLGMERKGHGGLGSGCRTDSRLLSRSWALETGQERKGWRKLGPRSRRFF